MTNRTLTQNQEDEALAFGEDSAPSSMTAASPGSVIQFQVRTSAAAGPDLVATGPDDFWEPIGPVAIRLVGNFDFPRLLVVEQVSKQRREKERL